MSSKIFYVLTLILLSKNAISDVDVKRNERSKTATIAITNRIAYEDSDRFAAELDALEREGYKLLLNAIQIDTRGGNVSSSREIGKLIRKKKLNTYLSPTAQCRSACIYILSGGIIRMAYGEVWVHRTTYSEDFPIDKIESAIRRVDKDTKEHIETMGLSLLVADAIVTTPYWASRQITYQEKRRWGIHGTERIAEELWFRTTAKSLNMTTDMLMEIYSDNFKRCDAMARGFEMTQYECVYNLASKRLYVR
jgi:hypothetical protein